MLRSNRFKGTNVELEIREFSEAIAVGSFGFLASIKAQLGSKALHRGVEQFDGAYALRE